MTQPTNGAPHVVKYSSARNEIMAECRCDWWDRTWEYAELELFRAVVVHMEETKPPTYVTWDGKMGEIAEILRTAYDKLAEGPHRWAKGAFARDQLGHKTPIAEGESWCSLGIIRWAVKQHDTDKNEYEGKLQKSMEILSQAAGLGFNMYSNFTLIPVWNDEVITYSQMLETFQKAVKVADERGL